jgi:hypothetical protein
MNLAAGYIAHTLQTHDESIADRVNEQRRRAADRRADGAGRAERSGLGHRISALLSHVGFGTATTRAAH